jgi:hypothetical protein
MNSLPNNTFTGAPSRTTVHPNYSYERIIFTTASGVLLMLFYGLVVNQMHWRLLLQQSISTKKRLLHWAGLLASLLNLIKGVDQQQVFGIYPCNYVLLITNNVTALVIACACVVVYALIQAQYQCTALLLINPARPLPSQNLGRIATGSAHYNSHANDDASSVRGKGMNNSTSIIMYRRLLQAVAGSTFAIFNVLTVCGIALNNRFYSALLLGSMLAVMALLIAIASWAVFSVHRAFAAFVKSVAVVESHRRTHLLSNTAVTIVPPMSFQINNNNNNINHHNNKSNIIATKEENNNNNNDDTKEENNKNNNTQPTTQPQPEQQQQQHRRRASLVKTQAELWKTTRYTLTVILIGIVCFGLVLTILLQSIAAGTVFDPLLVCRDSSVFFPDLFAYAHLAFFIVFLVWSWEQFLFLDCCTLCIPDCCCDACYRQSEAECFDIARLRQLRVAAEWTQQRHRHNVQHLYKNNQHRVGANSTESQHARRERQKTLRLMQREKSVLIQVKPLDPEVTLVQQ